MYRRDYRGSERGDKMKDIAEKYPKVWELFKKYGYENIGHDLYTKAFINARGNKGYNWVHLEHQLFGYLVLEFFPKHGIEIERFVRFYSEISKKQPEVLYLVMIPNDKYSELKTPQEAIEKAFEMLERKIR